MLGPAYQRGYGVWFRDGVIVYTVWKDTKVVRVASTVHTGNSHNQVKRLFQTSTGVVEVMVFILDATYDNNKKIGGVDLSDQLLQYFQTRCQTHNTSTARHSFTTALT